jgi:hypothetical protein
VTEREVSAFIQRCCQLERLNYGVETQKKNGQYSKVYGVAHCFVASLIHVAITVVYEFLPAYFTYKGKRESFFFLPCQQSEY